MALDTLSFGFQDAPGAGDTNTNIANTDLTQDANRVLTGGGFSLDFIGQSIFSVDSVIEFKNGTSAPDIRIYEASGGGTNYITLTCDALAANRTLTMPDATGTIALTSDIPVVPTYTAGDGITLNTLEFDLDAALTTVTTITNAALKLGRDADNTIDFGTDNEILFTVGGITEYKMRTDNFEPVTNGGATLGRTNKKWKDLFLASGGVINFDSGDSILSNDATGQLSFSTSNASLGVSIPSRGFRISSSTDGNVSSGDVVNFGTGTVVAGKCYYLTSSGAWALADRRTELPATSYLAVAMGGGAAGVVGMCIRGNVTMAIDVGSLGDKLYVRINGDLDNTSTTTSGEFVRLVGYCLDNSDGQIFFNPSMDWVEIA